MKRHFITKALTAGLCAAAGLFLVVESGTALAAAKGQASSRAPSPKISISGTSVLQTVFAYSEPNSTVGSSETYATFPGMFARITVPGDKPLLVLAEFGAESACYGGDAGSPDWCVVRILASGVGPMQPTVGNGTDFAFTTTDRGAATDASWRQHQMTRGILLKPGNYTIAAQGRVKRFGATIPTFWTGERTLTVQVIAP